MAWFTSTILIRWMMELVDMERRVLLKTLVAVSAFAGCSSDDSPGRANSSPRRTPTTEGANPATANTRRDSPNPRVPASAVDIPPGASVDVDVRVVADPTGESPTAIEIELTNESDGAREFGFGSTPPFDSGRAEEADLYLLDDEEAGSNPTGDRYYIPTAMEGDCWRVEHEPSFNDVAIPRELGAGETVSNTYVVLAGRDLTCPVDGSYRFESLVSISDGERSDHTLGFEVQYSRVE